MKIATQQPTHMRPSSITSRSAIPRAVAASPVQPPSTSPDITIDRRRTLASLLASPLLLTAVYQLPSPASAAPSSSGLRPMTDAERAAVDAAFASTLPKAKTAVALRLVFHDAGTYLKSENNGGANASLRLELERPENFGLKRGWGVIQQTAAKLKGTAADGKISQADLIALAGARAVKITGGPVIDVLVGRVDAEGPDPGGRLPMETLSAAEQLAAFEAMGFTAQEMLALCGSHTLGSKGYGDPVTFDNVYYQSLLKKPWESKEDPMAAMVGIPSDHVLPDDPTCRPIIEKYAADQATFFRDFAAAYLKLTELGVQQAA